MVTTTTTKEYGAISIKVMEGLEVVRNLVMHILVQHMRAGLHHLVYEVVDNLVDEALCGYCTSIKVDFTY